MGRDRDRSLRSEGEEDKHRLDGKDAKVPVKPESRDGSESGSERDERKEKRSHHDKRRGGRSRKRSRSRSSEDGDSESEFSESKSDYSDSDESESESETQSDDEDQRRRRKRKERKRREKEELEKKRRRKDKKRKKKRKEKEREEERKQKKRKERKKQKKKEKLERGKKGAVTNLWGKYGIIRETDMWNKRPEFTAWLAEVKQINLETLPNWEEKQMFKQFMEDHNTATFPSKKYYDLDAYYRHKMEKEMKRGAKKALDTERVVFNDEEIRRQELLAQREKQKEQEVETLKCAMQGGMAQAMKEQAQLREEMAWQYKLGNFEAAAAIQRRLDPDVAM